MKYVYSVLLVCSTLLACSIQLHAGTAMYRVFAVSGDVTVQERATSQFEKIKLNKSYPGTATIKVAQRAYCCVFASDGSPLEFRNEGKYELEREWNQHSRKSGSLYQKLSAFLLKAVNEGSAGQYLASVERAATTTLNPVFPYDMKVLDSAVTLHWNKESNNALYVVNIKSGGRVVYTKETTDTVLTVNLMKDIKEFKRGVCYMWSVSIKKNIQSASRDHCLLWADESLVSKTQKELGDFMHQDRGELKPGESPVAAALIAAWYQQRGFFTEAMRYYKQAVTLNDAYLPVLQAFVMKMGTARAEK